MTQNALKERFKRLHNKAGIPYTFFAKQVGITGAYMSLWMNDKRILSDTTAKELEKAYNNIIEEMKSND